MPNILLIVDFTDSKFLGECEWKCKKHGSKYHRQRRKLHIAIDAEIHQTPVVQLAINNVSDTQALEDLLAKIPLDQQINSVYTYDAYNIKHCR